MIAAIATILTLLFVAFELRANRRQNKLALLTALDQSWNNINAQIAQDEALGGVLTKGMYTPELLSDDEATRFLFLAAQYINNHKSIWTLFNEEGLHTHHELWIKFDISAIYNTPGFWKVFQSLEATMPIGFIELVSEQRKIKLERI